MTSKTESLAQGIAEEIEYKLRPDTASGKSVPNVQKITAIISEAIAPMEKELARVRQELEHQDQIEEDCAREHELRVAAEAKLRERDRDRDLFTEQLRIALGAPNDRTWFNTGLLEVAKTLRAKMVERDRDVQALLKACKDYKAAPSANHRDVLFATADKLRTGGAQ